MRQPGGGGFVQSRAMINRFHNSGHCWTFKAAASGQGNPLHHMSIEGCHLLVLPGMNFQSGPLGKQTMLNRKFVVMSFGRGRAAELYVLLDFQTFV